MPVSADPSGGPRLADVLARLPYLTVHLVEIADGRQWVADPESLAVWIDKTATPEQRNTWVCEAALAILEAKGVGGPVDRAGRRLRSVPPVPSAPRAAPS